MVNAHKNVMAHAYIVNCQSNVATMHFSIVFVAASGADPGFLEGGSDM